MQLQKETNIPGFENEHQKVMVNVFHTFNWCNDKMKQLIFPYDITNQQFSILRILRWQYPTPSTINFLKNRMLDKMCDASRIVDRLVQKGLVVKEPNKFDKRSVNILISEKGLELMKKMDDEINISNIVSSNLTEAEALQLNELLDKMRG
jgi:DNA-binding MarR family transcriptional regulator